jgi:sarcosine oxidase subunit beta
MTEESAPHPSAPLPRPSSGRYSLGRLLREGLNGQRGWSRAWAKALPRGRYRVVIVGGGGTPATAFIATTRRHSDVAVPERGAIGSATWA